MQSYLTSILEAVPHDIRLTTKEFISDNVSIFEPKEYVIGQTVNLEHYHFIILFSDPPILKLGKKEFQFHKKENRCFCTRHGSFGGSVHWWN